MLEQIYNKLPVFLQNIAISLFGYFWKKKRFGGIYKNEVRKVKLREFYTEKEWENYQTLKLRKLLLHAFDTVPFYQEKWKEFNITRDFLKTITLDKLKVLPYTTKEEFRKYGDNKMLSSTISPGEFHSSSGSTGTPVKIYMPNYASQKLAAFMEVRVLNWAGVKYSMPRGMVGGRRILPKNKMTPPFYRYNIFEKQTYFSAYHISESTIENYLAGIKNNNVSWMTGYAMSNYFIADFIRKQGLNSPKLNAVITSSEKLTKEMRDTISNVYKCKVYDSYSGSEGCGLISETPEGELLVNPDVGIMEFLDIEGNDVNFGEVGEIVSTGLINFDQPLIRYRIGDMARVSLNQNKKTRHEMVKVDEIIGRVEDVIIDKKGRKLVRFHSLFVDILGLIQSQLIQESYTEFTIKLKIDKHKFNKKLSEKQISERLISQIEISNIRFEYVDKFKVENNGKVKAVISKLNKFK